MDKNDLNRLRKLAFKYAPSKLKPIKIIETVESVYIMNEIYLNNKNKSSETESEQGLFLLT